MAAAVGEQVSDYSVFDYTLGTGSAFKGAAIFACDKESKSMRGVFANWDKEFMLHVVDIDLKQWLKDHKVSIFQESSAIDPADGARLVSEVLNLKLSGQILSCADFATETEYWKALRDDPGASRFQTYATDEEKTEVIMRGLEIIRTIMSDLAEKSPQNACSCLTQVSERVIAQRESNVHQRYVYHGMRPGFKDGDLLQEAFLAAKAANFGCKDGEKIHPSHP